MRWRNHARAIPDPELRALALNTQAGERGNLEGAAAFAVLAPRRRLAAVVRATVAFQALYDYVDTLAEQPTGNPLANGRTLHMTLLAALDPSRRHVDYYEHFRTGRDGGYLAAMIGSCRAAMRELPGSPHTRERALEATRRMVDYQSLNHAGRGQRQEALRAWADELTPASSGLCWWETAAGAASSLEVFALIAAAACGPTPEAEATAIHAAYFPWIGALHVLLDSLVDRGGDLRNGHHSLVAHYRDPQHAASRLSAIAEMSVELAGWLPDQRRHAMILAAMSSFYLSRASAGGPDALPAREAVLQAMGPLAAPTMAVLRARLAIARSLARQRSPASEKAPANSAT